MKHLLHFATICLFAMITLTVDAEPYVETSGSATGERRTEHLFTVPPDTELRITLSCTSNAARQGVYRIYFFAKRSAYAWRQLREMSLQFTETQAEVSDTFTLPPGEYKITISARYMDYKFKLEDNVPEE